MKEKLLITGGSGLLGGNISRIAAGDFETYATDNSHPMQSPACSFMLLDIRDKKQTLSVFKEIKPNLVIHTAALVNVDYCEGHPEEAWSNNVDGTEHVALASREVGAKLIHISTDSVFDGEKGMYAEEDTANPLNVYAKTKLEGEARVQRWLSDGLIIRTAFFSRSSPGGRSLAEWVINGLENGRILKMFTDAFFSPLPVNALAEAILAMYRKKLSGIYHVGCDGRYSKYAFGLEIARQLGFNSNNIQPSTLAEAKLKAPRPKDVSLNISKVFNAANIHFPDLREGVSQLREKTAFL